ncbi:centrosomal protein of 170 kDa isoform X3 [Lepisosteus oculatus]|uniref:centrosomal protein of 170 kDa isoform X3 n=1 Tax=Lepisosteus oculatus TaxID=7918 RepID=UPI0035F504EB
MSLTSWFLVSSGGTRHRLPREMIFVGRDDCELMLQSRSVDKQHAVINYEASTDEHKVKDLGSLNGTFVNDVRIQEQMYITLKMDDKLRFGYDTNLFTVVRGELHVPEEALKHEKFTSQLQLPKKPCEGEGLKPSCMKTPETKAAEACSEGSPKPAEPPKLDDKMAADIAALHRGTPLYGQPSWWGDDDADDENSFKQETKASAKKPDSGVTADGREPRKAEDQSGAEDGLHPLCREPSYFEIPTKEAQQVAPMADGGIQEIPTKDTEGGGAAGAAAQGHASFTIEFDDAAPGKVTIKDHVTKFTPDPRPRSKRSPQQGGKELTTLQAAIIASESKVADWLAQNDPPLARRESTEEDTKSIKSDVPVHLKRLKGSKHEDGTQSDSENGAGNQLTSRRAALEERLRSALSARGQAGASGEGRGAEGPVQSRTAFMIEFFDEENPRKRRSYSFTQAGGGVVAGEVPCPVPPPKPKGVPSPLPPPAPRPLPNQRSEDTCAVRLSASVGQQTSPGEEVDSAARPGGRENEDDHSDKGTYTIEMENPNPEEEEARQMIDKVFGVEESRDRSRPVVLEQPEGLTDWLSAAAGDPRKTSFIGSETLPEDAVAVGSPRWVSQWASLAANHTRPEADDPRSESPAFAAQEKEADASESAVSMKSTTSAASTSSHGERRRRTLPQLPTEDKGLDSARAKPGKSSTALGPRSEIGEKQDTEPQEKESQSSHRRRETDRASRAAHKGASGSPAAPEADRADVGTSTVKQALAKLQQQEQRGPQQQWGGSKPGAKPPGASTEKRLHRHDPGHREEDKRRRAEDGAGGPPGRGGESEKLGKPLVRQGSFTIEKPSSNVPIELIPRINKQMGSSSLARERSDSVGSLDTTLLLKDTEAVMAFLEAKLREENKLEGGGGGADPPSYPLEDSISPESDIDTASTISLAAGDADRKTAQKRRTLTSLQKEKSTVGSASKSAASARERLEKKAKLRPSESRPEARRSVQPGSRARQASVDLTDDDQTSSLPHSTISDILSSDQETYSGRSHGRGQLTSTDELLHSKLEAGKAARTRAPQAPSTGPGKPATLPRPRPTRASLLRRARLGDTSDNDLADADKVSVASEVSTTSSTSKPPSGRKTPSRLDMLAQPRRTRLGSLSARSDSEATTGRSSAASRAPDAVLRAGLRAPSASETKVAPRVRANSVSKLPDAKSKITSVHSSPSANARWRRFAPEYASTSEDEFGSNRNSPKHGRLRTGAALRGTRLQGSAPPSPGGVVLKHRMREQEEYIRDWTAHSEEIARISQDLAKDLAILAREIHDVAGEIDSVSSSGTAPSTTVSTAATTPGSAIDTREEVGPPLEGMTKLVDRVFDESLNFRKIPPVVQSRAPEINGRPVELRPRAADAPDPQAAIRRRTWNRDEAVLDSLLLTSVAQLSTKIRQSVDKTAGKIRILFKDKDRNWDEIENKLRAESDMPLLKTSNKEISSILQELKRVEKQLQVINVMVDPDGTLDALSSLGLTSPVLAKPGPRASGSRAPQVSGSSELESMESERDFSLHFNRFNPSGEEESSVVQE